MAIPNGQEVSYYTGPLPDFSRMPVNFGTIAHQIPASYTGSQQKPPSKIPVTVSSIPAKNLPKTVKVATNSTDMNFMVNSAREFLNNQTITPNQNITNGAKPVKKRERTTFSKPQYGIIQFPEEEHPLVKHVDWFETHWKSKRGCKPIHRIDDKFYSANRRIGLKQANGTLQIQFYYFNSKAIDLIVDLEF